MFNLTKLFYCGATATLVALPLQRAIKECITQRLGVGLVFTLETRLFTTCSHPIGPTPIPHQWIHLFTAVLLHEHHPIRIRLTDSRVLEHCGYGAGRRTSESSRPKRCALPTCTSSPKHTPTPCNIRGEDADRTRAASGRTIASASRTIAAAELLGNSRSSVRLLLRCVCMCRLAF